MTPHLAALLPVEDVLQSLTSPDKRLTLHRVFFDLYAASFPARARVPLCAVLAGGVGEYGLTVRLLDPAGREVARDSARFRASAMHAQALTLVGLLPAAGEYVLEAVLEDEVVAAIPLVVATVEQTNAP
jgi:hypothetical protein